MWALTGAWGVLYSGHILVPNPQIPPHVTHSTANVAHSSHRIMRKALHSATVIGVSEGNMTARAEYRKRTQQRQTVVFGSILATMGVLLLLSMLVWSGIMPVPFERKFSEAPDPNRAITPCLPAEPTPAVDLATITVNVYNSTNRTGIGGEASSAFTNMGISVPNPAANWSSSTLPEPARIITGPTGVVEAYTLAQYIPDSVIAINPDETTDVLTVVLGSAWDGLKAWQTVYLENPERLLTSQEGCVPTEEVQPADK